MIYVSGYGWVGMIDDGRRRWLAASYESCRGCPLCDDDS